MSRRALFAGLLITSVASSVAAPPAWWASRGATDSNTRADQAPVTQGQLKGFTQKAVQELNARIPGGAGSELNGLVAGWVLAYQSGGYNATNRLPADYQAMNLGQLKWIAGKIHERLVFAKYETAAPAWLVQNESTDKLLANLGQLKTVFNFDLTAPSGQLPLWWQRFYFDGQTDINPAGDDDYDGLTNINEYLHQLLPLARDTDGDDLPDGWEVANGLDPLDDGSFDVDNGATGDPDGDLVENMDEFWYSGNPWSTDTDSDTLDDFTEFNVTGTSLSSADPDEDGLTDKEEVEIYFTNPWAADGDNDGLTDPEEIFIFLTDPWSEDTDADGMEDGWEATYLLNPLSASDATLDPDGDFLSNVKESLLQLDPHSKDTDMDTVEDGDEDPDSDQLTNRSEISTHLTDPLDFDTDDDTLPDGFEVLSPHLDPLVANDPDLDFEPDGMSDSYEAVYGFDPDVDDSAGDPDGDGLTTAQEIVFGSDPTEADIDHDGLTDLEEKNNLPTATDPWKWDTDGDQLPDKWELDHGFDPTSGDDAYSDDDSDGLLLFQEYEKGTDPDLADTDGDGVTDGDEVAADTDPTDGDWGGVPPASPGNIQITLNPDGTTTFTWNDVSNNESGFRLRVKLPDGSWVVIADVAAGVTTFTTPGPQPLATTGSTAEVEAYNPFGSGFTPNGAPGPGGQPAGSGAPAVQPAVPETYQVAFDIRSEGKQVKNSCAVCHVLKVQVSGKLYGSGEQITLNKKQSYEITVIDKPNTDVPASPTPPHADTAKFTIWPQAVGNQSIAVSPVGSKEPDLFIATEGDILHYIIGNHEKLLVQDKAWPKNKAEEPMKKKAVITSPVFKLRDNADIHSGWDNTEVPYWTSVGVGKTKSIVRLRFPGAATGDLGSKFELVPHPDDTGKLGITNAAITQENTDFKVNGIAATGEDGTRIVLRAKAAPNPIAITLKAHVFDAVALSTGVFHIRDARNAHTAFASKRHAALYVGEMNKAFQDQCNITFNLTSQGDINMQYGDAPSPGPGENPPELPAIFNTNGAFPWDTARPAVYAEVSDATGVKVPIFIVENLAVASSPDMVGIVGGDRKEVYLKSSVEAIGAAHETGHLLFLSTRAEGQGNSHDLGPAPAELSGEPLMRPSETGLTSWMRRKDWYKANEKAKVR
ncbi:hypothetical protein JIN84_09405 [Luteolibacter yonseiensis]|uniref:Uncharacterized protein n=1 Tax=Luteolibacter yonseiensis TaxID=1144680 RepID=A0A934R4E5_9BACT|nr:hypothetical protein [Luteolibacter yonseiensis]MBK1815833.1 hypothetical protein [Luteolibacter yonseiensis]